MPFARDSILILDGAMGTELERRGVDVSLPLWSARALLDAPEMVERIHEEYLRAGARAITTNTFRTHRRSLEKAGLGDRARELTRRAVQLARTARDRAGVDAIVLGSVAPLEDCYHPELSPNAHVCREEHAEMITHLLDAGVDYVLIETVSARHEAMAMAEVAQRLAPGRWLMSFCTKAGGPPGVLLNGPPLADVLGAVGDACAVGINCVPAPDLARQLELLRRLLPATTPILAYGNSGAAQEDGTWSRTDADDPARFAEYAASWIDAGASIVGGCCGTTPETIGAIARRVT